MAEPDLEPVAHARCASGSRSVLPERTPTAARPRTDYAIFTNITEEAEHALLDRVREYRRQRYDAGYGAIALSTEIGGAGLSARFVVAFTAEEQGFDAPPSTELISVTCGLVGPTIATFGTDAQREKFARAFIRSDLLCCQLFSEPGAGSDLAAVATTAVQERDDWVINGQKVWSSGARFADYGLLLARTDPEVAKQAGLTMFLIPMDAPGVETRPIKQMSGASSFNEVFLSDVRINDDMRVGPVGDGWKVANATLGFERTASGQGTRRKGGSFDDLLGAGPSAGQDVRSAGASTARRRLRTHPVAHRHHRPRRPRHRGRCAARAGGIDRQDRRLAEPHPHRGCGGRRCWGRGWPPTPAKRTRSPGPSTCSVHLATGWRAAPTRCSATSSVSGCSACRASRASTGVSRTRSCRAAAERTFHPQMGTSATMRTI